MTSSITVLDSEENDAIDARASVFMKEGIRLMQSGNDTEAALVCFERALELRRRLPAEMAAYAYGLAACWLNRAEALTLLGSGYHALTLAAYDEALALLRTLPLGDDVRFSRRLAIAHQNRALVLAARNPPLTADAIAALRDAIAVLECGEAMATPERDRLLGVVWMNLANIQESAEAARRTLGFVKDLEHHDTRAGEAGLKARHVLCRIAARRLSDRAQCETNMDDVHDATDLADEGLALAREWQQRGVDRFRDLATDLHRFGARVYAHYQPHFLLEFLSEQQEQDTAAR